VAIPLCTLNGLRSTILMDRYVYRWFLFLITQPAFRAAAIDIGELSARYAVLDKIVLWQRILLLFAPFVAWGYLTTGNWFWIVGAIVLGLAGFKLLQAKRQEVAHIGVAVIARDFPTDTLAKLTLYQLCEIYSIKFDVLSLVDAIYHLDKIFRFTLLFSFLLVAYITNIKLWWIKQLLFLLLYLMVIVVVNMPFLYKKFR